MASDLERRLRRWEESAVIDATTLARIREFERARAAARSSRWAVAIALGFGGLLVCAGVLLFVSASWDVLSPAARTALVLAMVAVFHTAGAAASGKSAALASVLHAAGTVALGAGIFLVGQIFNLDEHWPSGILLWALGAWLAWAVLRDWPQMALAALLTPAWLLGEWAVLGESYDGFRLEGVAGTFAFLLAVTYFTSRRRDRFGDWQPVFLWTGGLALLPAAVALGVAAARHVSHMPGPSVLPAMPVQTLAVAWIVATVLPLIAAIVLRGRAWWWNLGATVWAVALCHVPLAGGRLAVYAWLAAGWIGLAAWGVLERRVERINLATVCFAVTVVTFYFDSFADKLGRSAGLAALGLLFLGGGYLLERTRKRIVGRTMGGAV